MVHTSLDVVDEKVSAMGKALVDQRELYLGLLYPTEDYKVYPFLGVHILGRELPCSTREWGLGVWGGGLKKMERASVCHEAGQPDVRRLTLC